MFVYENMELTDHDIGICINFQFANDPMADNGVTGLGFYKDLKNSITFNFDSVIFYPGYYDANVSKDRGIFVYLFIDQIETLYCNAINNKESDASSSADSIKSLQSEFISAFDVFATCMKASRSELKLKLSFLNSKEYFEPGKSNKLPGTALIFHRIALTKIKLVFNSDWINYERNLT